MLAQRFKGTLKTWANRHRPGALPDVFVFATPRSGSTWLAELVAAQPGFRLIDEPCNVRNPLVRWYSGLQDWEMLYRPDSTTTLQRYVERLQKGSLGFLNPSPLRPYYHAHTQRNVWKIHALEDRIPWLQQQFGGEVAVLLRHPIPVALSRRQTPRLTTMLQGDYNRHFSAAQLSHSRYILEHGDRLEQRVLSWCLQNMVRLAGVRERGVVVTYEQLVVDPEPALAWLAARWQLPAPDRLLAGLTRPSAVSAQSDATTQAVLAGPAASRPYLVEKWQQQVDKATAQRVMALLPLFGLDMYRHDSPYPTQPWWLSLPAQNSSRGFPTAPYSIESANG